ncbi:hypothetical protein LCGC14_1610080 [marine sediment metagenome]|uniref:Uncharacterized protein n=1 Tax=marine sediment metagenome TaxID=412755 RepID=A0A0F9I8K3_9ZZZZ
MIIRWYIDGNIARAKVQVGGTHYLEGNWKPDWVNMTARIAGKGSTPTILDINDDGVSIFTYRPAITEGQTEKRWTTISGNTLRDGSIITLDIDQIFDQDTLRDLTVELHLSEV